MASFSARRGACSAARQTEGLPNSDVGGPGRRHTETEIWPEGEDCLFTLSKVTNLAERWDKGQIVLYSLTSKTRTILVNGGSDARYLGTGHLVYALGGTLLAVPFDPGRPVITGGRVSVIQGVRRAAGGATGATELSISADGTLCTGQVRSKPRAPIGWWRQPIAQDRTLDSSFLRSHT